MKPFRPYGEFQRKLGQPRSALATIVSGTVTKIAPPPNVGNDNHQIYELLGFDELQNVVLTSPLAIDLPGGSIPAGTRVKSHYVFFDPSASSTIGGTAIFDDDILGIMTSTNTLQTSDFLGAPGTNYLSPSMRGLESNDSAVITDARTVTVSFFASSPGDYIRVITAPEPTTLSMLALAGFILRKRR